MKLEVLNRSKYRDGSAPGDDVLLVVPGSVYGIFDGATDPLGTVIDGVAAGRLAAMTVASEMATIALDPVARRMPGADIVERLSKVLKAQTDPLNLDVPPSTTLAVALDCGETWRFLLLGDSGIRLNSKDVHHHEKTIDFVSTAARVAVFNMLSRQNSDLDQVEMATRRCIFLGFDTAISEGVLTTVRALEIVEEAIFATGLNKIRQTVSGFLMGGIQKQFKFGNTVGNPLCFDTMDGTMPKLGDLQDFERAAKDITSIEIFTDGYPSQPTYASVAAWEKAFHAAEDCDFHKTGPFSTVKGSTSAEFYDDRSVLILRCPLVT
jgi:hypothetical protein